MSQLIQSRAEFRQLSELRLAEAKLLLDHEKWCGAYYLAGYAVELALKECVISRLLATDAFPEKRFSESCYTHSIKQLIALVKLTDAFETAVGADSTLEIHRRLVYEWSEEKRYHRISQFEAESLYRAVTDPDHGVLPWITTNC